MNYPFPERALKKWAVNNLTVNEEESSFQFMYNGSTCRNGGTPFKALFSLDVDENIMIRNPRIEIPEEEKEAADKMCGRGYETYTHPEGEILADYILRDLPQNFAGCLCSAPMINQKWKMVAATVHYYLSENQG